MFYAINSRTGERVNSLNLENNPAYEFIKEDIWYADIDEIETCPEKIDINKIIVIFREGSTGLISSLGNKYAISPHFFIPNKSKLGINTIPESKEHKLAKNWIYNRLIKPNQDKFVINYSKLNKGQYFNNFNLLELPIDKDNINIEVNSSLFDKTRRADIICPFKIRHPILGNGIVFEIQFSKQKEKTKISRELDWAIRGYSIAWLFKEDINFISENIIDIKKESINVDSFANLIKINKEKQIRELKFVVQEEITKINLKIEEFKDEIEKQKVEIQKTKVNNINLDWGVIERYINTKLVSFRKSIQPMCPKCKVLMILKNGNDNQFWGCSNFPNCRMTMAVLD